MNAIKQLILKSFDVYNQQPKKNRLACFCKKAILIAAFGVMDLNHFHPKILLKLKLISAEWTLAVNFENFFLCVIYH